MCRLKFGHEIAETCHFNDRQWILITGYCSYHSPRAHPKQNERRKLARKKFAREAAKDRLRVHWEKEKFRQRDDRPNAQPWLRLEVKSPNSPRRRRRECKIAPSCSTESACRTVNKSLINNCLKPMNFYRTSGSTLMVLLFVSCTIAIKFIEMFVLSM